jgi:hypothetical protein
MCHQAPRCQALAHAVSWCQSTLRIRLHKRTNCVTCSDRANCANIGRQAGRFTLPPNNFRPLSCIFGTKSGQALFRLSMWMCIELELQGRYGNKKFHSKIHPGMRPHVPHHIWPHIPVRAEAIEVHGVPFQALLCQDQQRYDLAPRRRHELELK